MKICTVNMNRQTDKAYAKFRKERTTETYDKFKSLRNRSQGEVKKAKRNYIKREIQENEKDTKKLWQVMKNLGMPSKTKSNSNNVGLKIENGDVCFEAKYVAKSFNNFFCSIAEKLVSKLDKRDFNENGLKDYYRQQGIDNNSFNLKYVNVTDVWKQLRS